MLLGAACFKLRFAWGGTGGCADTVDVRTHIARALLVFGHGVLRVLGAYVVTDPKRLVACGFELAQGVVAQRFAVGAQRDGSACGKEWAKACERIDVDEPLLGMSSLGAWSWEVKRDGIELSSAKDARERARFARDQDRVCDARLNNTLRGVGNADGLLIGADKERVGFDFGTLYQVCSLSAAKIEMKAGKGFAAGEGAGFAPVTDIALGARFDRVGIALQALL